MAPPASATNLAVTAVGVHALLFTWTDGVGSTETRIFRGLDNVFGNATQVETILASIEQFDDLTLPAKKAQFYWAVAANIDGAAAEAGPVSATTLDADVNFTEMETGVAAVIESICGHKVILEDANGPDPDKPFVTIKIHGAIKIGSRDDLQPDGNQGGQRHFNLSISVYADGNEAFQCAEQIQSAFDTPAVMEKLALRDLAIGTIGDVLDLGAALADRFEERSQFDVVLKKASNKDGAAGIERIESVNFNFNEESVS